MFTPARRQVPAPSLSIRVVWVEVGLAMAPLTVLESVLDPSSTTTRAPVVPKLKALNKFTCLAPLLMSCMPDVLVVVTLGMAQVMFVRFAVPAFGSLKITVPTEPLGVRVLVPWLYPASASWSPEPNISYRRPLKLLLLSVNVRATERSPATLVVSTPVLRSPANSSMPTPTVTPPEKSFPALVNCHRPVTPKRSSSPVAGMLRLMTLAASVIAPVILFMTGLK